MAKKKSQKQIPGNYSGTRAKKDNTYENNRRRNYMILSTAAIIIGLIMMNWQSLGSSRTTMELAYSDVTTEIREMEDAVKSYADQAGEASKAAGDAYLKAYKTLQEAESAEERSEAASAYTQAFSALQEAADKAGMSDASYVEARDAARKAMEGFRTAVADYNTKAASYNKTVTGFPTRILASVMRYEKAGLI